MSGKKSKIQSVASMSVHHENAAGIDLGSRDHFVALPDGRSATTVRKFGCYTEDLEAMAAWLKENRIDTIAMESTGVFWVPVFQLLAKAGFDVQLVSTKHLKTVPGRKTDVEDCQWIQLLHERGMLRGSFRPEEAICVVRGYMRHRDVLTREGAELIQRMQKSLEQMNVQLHKAVSSITGQTGMAIIDAILGGERDGMKLASLRDGRCKKTEAEIAKALRGDFRDEFLFCLRQDVDGYRFIQKQIDECEAQILERWREFETKADVAKAPAAKSHKERTEVRLELFRVTGTDLSVIPGLGSRNLQTLLAEVGFDLSRFPNEKAFSSWATVAPRNNISGGRRRHSPPTSASSKVSQVFRIAAQTLANSKTALGAFYRRMRNRKGGTFAVAVTAHKLAKLFYRVLRHGTAYVEKGADYYDERYKNQRIKTALKTLKNLGYQPPTEAVPWFVR
jgi:transposase